MIAAGFKDHAGRFTGFVAVRPTCALGTGERGGEETDFVVGERFHQFDGLGEFVLGGRGTVKGFVDGCWAGDVELYFGQRVQPMRRSSRAGFRPSVCMQTVRPPLARLLHQFDRSDLPPPPGTGKGRGRKSSRAAGRCA